MFPSLITTLYNLLHCTTVTTLFLRAIHLPNSQYDAKRNCGVTIVELQVADNIPWQCTVRDDVHSVDKYPKLSKSTWPCPTQSP